MALPELSHGLSGGFLRMVEGLSATAPTLLVGIGVAAVFRYYLGPEGTRRLFGGESLRALPQAWLVGMLLPVCSIGVIPIMAEMYRARVRAGALSAFALSAPLFNPLSLLYGLTLSRPFVVIFFVLGSLFVVTTVGWLWDRRGTSLVVEQSASDNDEREEKGQWTGVYRLFAVGVYYGRTLAGAAGLWTVVALIGLMLLSMVLPFGAMQESVERDDWWAPSTMTAVAIPAYATPMLAMTQLGMMFQHANSPGAAFVLLVLGAGMNLATLGWLAYHFGLRSVAVWFGTLLITVVTIAYAINKPLVPVGVEPAGHTHAFDIYTNPLQPAMGPSVQLLWQQLVDRLDVWERASLASLGCLLLAGVLLRLLGWDERWLRKWQRRPAEGDSAREEAGSAARGEASPGWRFDRDVSPRVVGMTALVGLVVISVVMCYSYYPGPKESLAEIAAIRAECLSAANSGNIEHAAYHLRLWDDWSRRLEVGTYLRTGTLRPYQRMQGYLLRKKLELLEHELEHDPFEIEETRKVVREILSTDRRWTRAFRPPRQGDGPVSAAFLGTDGPKPVGSAQ